MGNPLTAFTANPYAVPALPTGASPATPVLRGPILIPIDSVYPYAADGVGNSLPPGYVSPGKPVLNPYPVGRDLYAINGAVGQEYLHHDGG